ncbi:MAG TPA: DUF1698 domain-containing protein [Phycisphaerales bacterium]|nr:DUF1698 domain-containing protein [Phycisphaerales bacterium]
MENIKKRVEAIPYWYHKIELPDGTVTPGFAPLEPGRYCVPDDLTGKRVLDVGAWDGYWTFEALKRGAKEVVAIDDFSDTAGLDITRGNAWETFDLCAEAFGFENSISKVLKFDPLYLENNKGQKVSSREMSVYDISEETFGRFDVVFFFGTIYHLKHPFLALEKISEVCDGALYVETASLDDFSPYRGGIGQGFNQNENVMEFYPGNQYASNESNWWVPTLQCLGAMMESVGFKGIECWPLTEDPKELPHCRGFASGTKDADVMVANSPPEVTTNTPLAVLKVAAVMSVPRLGFMDNMMCASEAFFAMRIPMLCVQGAFWGQCLERGMQQLIDSNVDIILTVDYDTLFKKEDAEAVIRLMYENPDVTAIVPVHRGRGDFPVLMSMKSKSGQVRKDVPLTELAGETTKIATGHFGLTAIRVKDLMDIPHPWFQGQPNKDGMWGPGRVDDDIYFWHILEEYKKTVLLANHVTVGHLELKANWPDESMQPIYQTPGDFHDKGKPKNVWK